MRNQRYSIWSLFWAGALAFWSGTSTATACSVTDDYVRPTNFELIQLADAIVVATAKKETKSSVTTAVEFRVDKIFKGAPTKKFISEFAGLGAPSPSDPNNISGSHPEGHAGPCNRTTFAKNERYVVFLAKGSDNTYWQLDFPFSRVNEDYNGDGSFWVRTIQAYLALQNKYAPMEQLEALELLLRENLKGAQTSESTAQAIDVLDHLRSRSPYKPTAYLVQTYETLERGEAPKYGVRSRSADRESSPARDLTDFVLGKAAPPDKMSTEAEKYHVLKSLVLGTHPTAATLFDRLVGVPHPTASHLALAIRFFAKNNQYRRAYTLIETQAIRMLASIPREDARRLIANITDAQTGDKYDSRRTNSERWHSDPYVAAAWPELALHLYWFRYYAFGPDDAYPDTEAITRIRPANYRARPLVTLALARGSDPGVERWAFSELLDESARKAWDAKGDDKDDEQDPALLPMQVLVRSFGDERDAVLKKVACQSDARRHLLIVTLGHWGGSLADDELSQIAARPGVDDDERIFIGQAFARLYARQASRNAQQGLTSVLEGHSEYALLENVIRREKITRLGEPVTPLKCPN